MPTHGRGQKSRFASLVVLALVLTNGLAAVAQSVNEQALPQSLWIAANVIGLVAAGLSGILDLRATGRSSDTLPPGPLGTGSGVSGAWLAASAVFALVTLFVPFAAPLALFGVLMAFKRRRAAAGAALATLTIGAGAVFVLLLTYTYA